MKTTMTIYRVKLLDKDGLRAAYFYCGTIREANLFISHWGYGDGSNIQPIHVSPNRQGVIDALNRYGSGVDATAEEANIDGYG